MVRVGFKRKLRLVLFSSKALVYGADVPVMFMSQVRRVLSCGPMTNNLCTVRESALAEATPAITTTAPSVTKPPYVHALDDHHDWPCASNQQRGGDFATIIASVVALVSLLGNTSITRKTSIPV